MVVSLPMQPTNNKIDHYITLYVSNVSYELSSGQLTLSDMGGGGGFRPPRKFSFIRFSLFAGCL